MKEIGILLLKFLGMAAIYYFFVICPILGVGKAYDQGAITGFFLAKSIVMLLISRPLLAGYASAVGLSK